MKKLFTTFIICVLSNFICFSQHSISYSHLEIISSSSSFSYYNNHFQPDYNSIANTLSTRQARFDYNHGMVSNAWGKVKHCELINTYNNRKVRNKDIQITKYLNQKNQFRNVDWSMNRDFAIRVSSYMTDIFNDKYIKTEIKMLQAINNEYSRLKRTYPDDFYKRQRYFDIGKVLKLLETCQPSEIPKIAIKYGLF